MIPFIGKSSEGGAKLAEEPEWAAARRAMGQQLRDYHITDERILAAMSKVKRHKFIPEDLCSRSTAYGDYPCPIGYGQTISQPYIVAYMTEKLELKPGDKVLEIGTGSGYQAAVLAECGAEVYTIEIVPELARHARAALDAEGYQNVRVLAGDGYKGWPEYSPFDAIIVTCAPSDVPETLKEQLKEGGRLIAPVGRMFQRLVILRKKDGRIEQQEDLPVRFVPMVRE
ncbi:MAG: protein-L-isoaspartate(D-aspartate) O-methyltransferase [Lentisphaerae bacterium]|nr:protein-L-isoaspartate(D-aspartate) O-methyltransferase [Lentisphaerota bacterium]